MAIGGVAEILWGVSAEGAPTPPARARLDLGLALDAGGRAYPPLPVDREVATIELREAVAEGRVRPLPRGQFAPVGTPRESG